MVFSGVFVRRISAHAAGIIFCVLAYIAASRGIYIGQENHAGLLPVVRRLLDANYLPGDFGIALRLHHHRIFAGIVAGLSRLPWGEKGALVGLTVAGTGLVFAGLWDLCAALGIRLAGRFLLGVALAVGFAFLGHGAEANLLLGNGPIMPPTFAHAFILFSVAAMVRGRWNAALAWTGLVALLHLQIGGVWLLVLVLAMLQSDARRSPARWLPGLLAMLAIASPALADVSALLRHGLVSHVGDMSDAALRMPQHFAFYGGRVAAVMFYVAVLFALRRRWIRRGDPRAAAFRIIWMLSLIVSALMVAHYLDYYFLHIGWIARMQPLRLTPLLPLFGGLSVVAALQGAENARRHAWMVLAALALFVADGAGRALQGEPFSLAVHADSGMDRDWVDVCRWIDRFGPRGLYVTPPGEIGFTSLSNRSTLVEFKINPDGGAGLDEWTRRLRAVSGGRLPPVSNRRIVGDALNAAYARLSPAELDALARDYGVRYAVVPLGAARVGRELYANGQYRVTALAPAGR